MKEEKISWDQHRTKAFNLRVFFLLDILRDNMISITFFYLTVEVEVAEVSSILSYVLTSFPEELVLCLQFTGYLSYFFGSVLYLLVIYISL